MSIAFAEVEPFKPHFRSTRVVTSGSHLRYTTPDGGPTPLAKIQMGTFPEFEDLHLRTVLEKDARRTQQIVYETRVDPERSRLATEIKTLRSKIASIRKSAMTKYRTDRRAAWAQFKGQCRYWKEWGTYVVKDRGRYGDLVRIPTHFVTKYVTVRKRDRQVWKWIYDNVLEWRVNRHGKAYQVWVHRNYRRELRWIYKTVSFTYRKADAWKTVRKWVTRRITKPIIGKNGQTGRWLIDRKRYEELKQQWFIDHYALRYLNDTDYFLLDQELEDKRLKLSRMPHSQPNSACHECDTSTVEIRESVGVDMTLTDGTGTVDGWFQPSYFIQKPQACFMPICYQITSMFRDGTAESYVNDKYKVDVPLVLDQGLTAPTSMKVSDVSLARLPYLETSVEDAKRALESAYWKEAALDFNKTEDADLARIVTEDFGVDLKETKKTTDIVVDPVGGITAQLVPDFFRFCESLDNYAEAKRLIDGLGLGLREKLKARFQITAVTVTFTVRQVAALYLAWKFGFEPLMEDVRALLSGCVTTMWKVHSGITELLKGNRGKDIIPLTARTSVETRDEVVKASQPLTSTYTNIYRCRLRDFSLEKSYNDYDYPSWVQRVLQHAEAAFDKPNAGVYCQTVPFDLYKVSGSDETKLDLGGPFGGPMLFLREMGQNDHKPWREFTRLSGEAAELRVPLACARRYTLCRAFARWQVDQLNAAENDTLIGVISDEANSWTDQAITLGRRGLFRALELSWELYPKSFVTNWFVNVDRILQRIRTLGDAYAYGFPVDGIWGSVRTELYVATEFTVLHQRALRFPSPEAYATGLSTPSSIYYPREEVKREIRGATSYEILDTFQVTNTPLLRRSGITSFMRSPLLADVSLGTFISPLSFRRLNTGKVASLLALAANLLPNLVYKKPRVKIS